MARDCQKGIAGIIDCWQKRKVAPQLRRRLDPALLVLDGESIWPYLRRTHPAQDALQASDRRTDIIVVTVGAQRELCMLGQGGGAE